MQELSRCVLLGQAGRTAEEISQHMTAYLQKVRRQAEPKGFWGTLGYYLGGQAGEIKAGIQQSQAEVAYGRRRQEHVARAGPPPTWGGGPCADVRVDAGHDRRGAGAARRFHRGRVRG